MSIVINSLNNSIISNIPCIKFYANTPFRLGLRNNGTSSLITGSPQWDGSMYIKYTGLDVWREWDGSVSSPSRTIYLRGKNNTKVTDWSGSFSFCKENNKYVAFEDSVFCDGEIGSLLDSDKVAEGKLKKALDDSFRYVFYHAPLVNAPKINFEEIGDRAFISAFSSCKNLTSLPSLPAAVVGVYGYSYMFLSTAISSLPKLPAISVRSYGYSSMFQSTNIKLSLTQTGEYQYPFRVPAKGNGNFENYALNNMVKDTKGTYTGDADGTIQGNTTYYTDKPLVE